MNRIAFVMCLLLTACGGSPDADKSAGEARLAAKAVADVDAAHAEAAAPVAGQVPTP